ncbi:MAG: amidohydrolase family protein [Candidatus Acidiferrum sp.]
MKLRNLRPRLEMIVLTIMSMSVFGVVQLRAQGGEPRSFAIRGAKIIPVSGPAIDNATLVVSKGIIIALGKDEAIPPDAWVIEGKGLTVYPGFIDSFTDVGIAAVQSDGDGKGKPQALSKGPEDRPATTPWRNAADEINVNDPRIETWRAAGFTTTISAPKGGMFPGQAAVLDLAGDRPGNFVVKNMSAIPVSLQAPGGFRSYPGSLMGAIAYVRQVWIDTNWDALAEASYEKSPRGTERPRYDRTEFALNDALAKHALVLLPGNTSSEIQRAMRLATEWKLNVAIYGGQMGYEVATELAAKKTPVLVNLKWPEAEKDADPDAETSLRTLRFRDRAPSSPAALQKAGVKFVFYSGGIASPKDLFPAVKKSIDAGLSPDAALRALTLSAAEIYGIADVLGSIEKGKIANLVVTDGDIFDKKTKIRIVFVDGRKFEVREPLRPSEPPKGDLTGKWKLTYTTPQGQEESVADLVMSSDGTLTGTLSSHRGTGTIFGGYLSGDKFSFTINIPVEGSPQDVHFSGTFDGTTMKGTIGAMGYSFDFSGTKPGVATMTAGGAK